MLTDEFHDLMLAFTWTTGIREDDGQIFPEIVGLNTFFDVFADLKTDIPEECGAWCD